MRTHRLLWFTTIALAAAGCGSKKASGPGNQTAGQPVETRAPNAEGQQPAHPGQTRAPYRTADVTFETRTIARGLEHPWGLAFLPDGAMLVTEKPGRLRVVSPTGELSPPVDGLPKVDARGQGGLLDVAIDPDFATNQLVYWSYSEPREGGNGTAVARGRLVRGNGSPRIDAATVIWRMTPTLDSTLHFGSRFVFRGDGTLFVTTGERSILPGRAQAQQLDSAFGKLIRIALDGSIPKDNPHVDRQGVLPEIWSVGHRNIQAAALHPRTRKLWVVDHGPKGGDEINIVDAGKNYGWPVITYGEEYSGEPIGTGLTAQPGMEQPLYYWDPVIAPSGMAFYDADLFPAWRGSLFVGALAGKHLVRLTLDEDRVVGEERLLVDRARIRDVRVGPDGAIYVLTDADAGELLLLEPAEARAGEST
ncbi:MAG: PQQ-dependent sugar dehydrogenase [Myxococcota bacterium]|nr:PQQ-dependent sugar dehydrogenase [Myxococcota bacterium]